MVTRELRLDKKDVTRVNESDQFVIEISDSDNGKKSLSSSFIILIIVIIIITVVKVRGLGGLSPLLPFEPSLQ